jgi:hypothetical protein
MFGIRSSDTAIGTYTGSGGYLARQWRDLPLPTPLSADTRYHLTI